jgi:hypothetical protein
MGYVKTTEHAAVAALAPAELRGSAFRLLVDGRPSRRSRANAPANLLPRRRLRVVGAPFGHCDGARLGFDDGRFVSVQSAGAPTEPLPGAPRRVDGRGRRSFRWSFPHAIPGTTGRHQADDVPDLSSNNGTQRDGSDSR